MRFLRLVSAAVTAVALVVALAPTTLGVAQQRTVQILDNCDGPTFNAPEAIGPGACARGSGLTFQKLVAALSRGGAQSWRFAPERVKLATGGTIKAINRGGEFHTFTEVANFGGGCVPDINAALGLVPVAECAGAPAIFGTTGVPPGASLTTAPLSAGTHRFQCLIHPWQRTTATVG
jgi:plastocyanin